MKTRELHYEKCNISVNQEALSRDMEKWWHYCTGRILDLDNPQSFNEKIQWLKLYDSTPMKTRLADKHLVQEWIKEKIGEEHLIKTLGVWDDANDIDFDLLPNRFILKTNHGSGWNIIVKDKQTLDYEKIRSTLSEWLTYDFGSRHGPGFELHYMPIAPKILAEEYMETLDGDLYEYCYLCFNGVPKFIWYDATENGKRFYRYFDLDWNLIDHLERFPGDSGAVEKPKNLEKMNEIARELCKDFPLVRVDLYNIHGAIYFCEMTFTSNNGIIYEHNEDKYEQFGGKIMLPPKSPAPLRNMGSMVASNIDSAKITVVLLCETNRSCEIQTSLQSLISQTFEDIEIICINNGASDQAKRHMVQYAQRDERIALIDTRYKMTPKELFDIAAQTAKGDYLLFVDGGDALKPDALHLLFDAVDQHDLDIVLFGGEAFSENEHTPKSDLIKREKCLNRVASGLNMLALQHSNEEYAAYPVLSMMRSEYFRKQELRFSSDSLFDDELVMPMLLLNASRTMCINDQLYIRNTETGKAHGEKEAVKAFANYYIAYEELLSKYIQSGSKSVGLRLATDRNYIKCWELYRRLSSQEVDELMNILPADYVHLYRIRDFQVLDWQRKCSLLEAQNNTFAQRAYRLMIQGIHYLKEHGPRDTAIRTLAKIKKKLFSI